MENRIADLFEQELVVINIGVALFGEAIKRQGIKVCQVNWSPPAEIDKEMHDILEDLGGI